MVVAKPQCPTKQEQSWAMSLSASVLPCNVGRLYNCSLKFATYLLYRLWGGYSLPSRLPAAQTKTLKSSPSNMSSCIILLASWTPKTLPSTRSCLCPFLALKEILHLVSISTACRCAVVTVCCSPVTTSTWTCDMAGTKRWLAGREILRTGCCRQFSTVDLTLLSAAICLRLCPRSTVATHSGVSHALAALLRQNQHALSLMSPSWSRDNVISKSQIRN